jgi:hypothetical protein
MSPQRLFELNRRLGDLRGRNPHGDPVYRWFHSKDLTYPARENDGIFRWVRQVDEDCYLIGMWQPPPSRETWKAQFPDIGYPERGIYYATDKILRAGVEPSDGLTDQIAGLIKELGMKTMRDILDEFEMARERQDKRQEDLISDIVENSVTAFGNDPGKRGGSVSFGGIEAATSN